MSVKNLNVADIALIELARGEAGAPRDVFDDLRRKGFVSFSNGKPSLTAAGKSRAAKLKDVEHNLRKMFTARVAGKGGCAINTAAGSRLHC